MPSSLRYGRECRASLVLNSFDAPGPPNPLSQGAGLWSPFGYRSVTTLPQRRSFQVLLRVYKGVRVVRTRRNVLTEPALAENAEATLRRLQKAGIVVRPGVDKDGRLDRSILLESPLNEKLQKRLSQK